jgi:hypothetical protein
MIPVWPGRREAALRHWGIIQVRARALAAFAHLETTFDTFRKRLLSSKRRYVVL